MDSNQFEVLQSISEYVRDIGTSLQDEDRRGEYLHSGVKVSVDQATLEKLAEELKAERDNLQSVQSKTA